MAILALALALLFVPAQVIAIDPAPWRIPTPLYAHIYMLALAGCVIYDVNHLVTRGVVSIVDIDALTQNFDKHISNPACDDWYYAIEVDSSLYPSAPANCKADEDIAAMACFKDGRNLEFVPKPLQDDYNYIVINAIRQNGSSLQYASDRMKATKKVVMDAVANDPHALMFAAKHLKADEDVIQLAMSIDPFVLKYLPYMFKNDAGIVYNAIRRNGSSLQYASDRLKAIKHVVMAAIANDPHALMFAAKYLKADEDLIRLAMSKDKSVFKYLPEEIVYAAMKNDVSVLEYASDSLKADLGFIFFALTHSYDAVRYIPPSAAKDIAVAAYMSNPMCRPFVRPSVGLDGKIRLSCLSFGTR
jgi:hypothetical protein